MTKLFCFPYAGGSANVFNKFKPFMAPGLELVPVELAGRGKRIAEPPFESVAEALEDIMARIGKDLCNGPYMLFGHSLGAIMAYELAQQIRQQGFPEPRHLFLSGKGGPHARPADKKQYHTMDDATFKQEILELGGTPKEFFEHPELMELFLPMLKTDFKVAELYAPVPEIDPLPYDLTIFMGKEDSFNAEECDSWKQYTKGLCTIFHFNGGHFFIHDEVKAIASVINARFRDIEI